MTRRKTHTSSDTGHVDSYHCKSSNGGGLSPFTPSRRGAGGGGGGAAVGVGRGAGRAPPPPAAHFLASQKENYTGIIYPILARRIFEYGEIQMLSLYVILILYLNRSIYFNMLESNKLEDCPTSGGTTLVMLLLLKQSKVAHVSSAPLQHPELRHKPELITKQVAKGRVSSVIICLV